MLAYLIPSFVFLLKKSSSDATLVYQYKTPARDGCYFYASRTIMSNWQIFWQEPIFQTTKFFCVCLSAVQRRREWSPFLESQSNHNLMNHFLQIRQFSIYTKPYLTALFSCRQKKPTQRLLLLLQWSTSAKILAFGLFFMLLVILVQWV